MRIFLWTTPLLFLPAALAAQSPRPQAGSVWLSVGVGSGSASFSCDACGSRRNNALAGVARVSVAVHRALTLGVEVSGWTSDFSDPRGSGAARMLFTNVVAQWYPAASGVFMKAGAGVASIRDAITFTQIGRAIVTTHSPSFVVGAGWHVSVAQRWSLTPYADLNVARKAALTVNGFRAATQLGGSLVHIGAAVTVR
jgi:hypothetical protein